jgi:hypothetical protein
MRSSQRAVEPTAALILSARAVRCTTWIACEGVMRRAMAIRQAPRRDAPPGNGLQRCASRFPQPCPPPRWRTSPPRQTYFDPARAELYTFCSTGRQQKIPCCEGRTISRNVSKFAEALQTPVSQSSNGRVAQSLASSWGPWAIGHRSEPCSLANRSSKRKVRMPFSLRTSLGSALRNRFSGRLVAAQRRMSA